MNKVLDLFCGAGGFTEGFTQAGFNVIAGIDNNKEAIEAYKLNHNHKALCRDLRNYHPEHFSLELKSMDIKEIDIIIGGPPCQGFSIGGKRDITDPRNTLFMEFVKYLDYFKPKAFIMENVIGILSMKNDKKEKVIDIISKVLKVNFKICICKLYASDFGVPQNRRRVIIFGIRKDLNIQPYGPQVLYEKDKRPAVSTVLEPKENIDQSYYLSKRVLEVIKNRKERMKKEGKRGSGFAKFLNIDKPSCTIPAQYYYDALVKYDEDTVRKLTLKELSAIQSFPENYQFYGSKAKKTMQIGNAIPPLFAFHIANHIKSFFI